MEHDLTVLGLRPLHPWMREVISYCVIMQCVIVVFNLCVFYLCVTRHPYCNVCVGEESSTGLVRVQACKLSRRETQKPRACEIGFSFSGHQ